MRILAPAKINVFLRITGRRPDGYHLLDSLMVPISLCDEVQIEAWNGERKKVVSSQHSVVSSEEETITITCDDPTLPTDGTNLAYKAAALLCKEANIQARIVIHLRKRIPAGAGLGGGSSDAAAVLKGLNTLLSFGLDEKRLCILAARLGADVPFFIPCKPARVQGIGEILTPVPPLPAKWFVVIVPPFGVSTPWAYRRFDELPPLGNDSQHIELTAGQWPQAQLLVNDLERAVIPAHPLIAELKERLFRQGAEHALMSGSGSAVFGMFAVRTQAEHAAHALREMGKTFVVEHLKQ
ncbi:MAG: 4-(cytidine 5'-diphospho)-2-C-methyl-D-erythritol kinase [Deltaproteobacteria bacterium]|nr:4-(cytidine 5'-diphospho)-2-C-methyl-D-erythritol kinase [Deltaproteobacteria bacterium]